MESSSQEIVNGRYRLVRCLGEGGMGSVYLSADLAEEQRPVALKRVHSTLLTPNGIDAFKAEFSAMTRLRHPNVVEVYDFGLDSATGEHFLTLEYVEGTDLRQAAAGLDRPAVLELLVQVCRGLEYIHSRGLVHNDLKPQNILVSSAAPRTCKLMDFGLASVEAAAGSGPAGLRGTLQYLAPELIRGAAADRRSDLYSLGVLFYLLLAGRLPFDGEPSEILARATSQAPEPLSRHAEGIEPPLEALVLRLLEKDPLARPDSAAGVIAAVAAASGLPFPVETPATIASAVRSGKFVGRQRELDRLVRHVDASLASGGEGAGRLILLSGESGVGKSRLVRQLRFEAQMRGVRVVTGQCYEGSASAFHPFVQIIRQILPDGLRGGELASLIPEAPAAGAAPAMDPEHAQRQVVGAAVQRLLETAEASPLMVCLEDLQWADTASIALLEHLARNVSSSARLVLVATYRSEESEGPPLSTALPRLLRAGNWERLELSRLREAELAEMLEGMFGLEEVPSELVELMLRETEGNPFYIQVALESLLEDQAHAATAGGRLLDFKGLAQLPFPRSLSEAIARRVGRLYDEERRVLEAMAVIESPVEPAALQRVMAGPAAAALPDGVFQGAVDRLARRHLARRDIGASGRLRLRIDHVKIREHVYDGMDWQERRALHGRIGEALEKEGRAGVEELAHHFVHSADPVKALDYAERAGLHALSLFATERSVAFLERALDLVPPSDPERRLTLQLSLGDAYRQGRDHARAIETYDKVIKGSRVSGHKDLHWKASAHLLDVLARVGQHDEAQRSAERLIPTLRAEGARGHLAMVLTTLGSSMGAQGRLQESRELNEEALALRRELRDLPGMAANLNNLGLIDLLTETSEQGLALLEESLSLRRRIGDEQHACEALQNIGWWHRRRGAMAAAAGSTEEAAAMARRNHDRWMLAVTETSLAAIYQTQGRLDAALKAARRAVADAQSIGDEERECEALDFLGMIQRDLGDLAGAVGSHERAVSTARRAGLPSQEVYAAASLALDRLASAPSPQDVRSVRDALRRAARAAVSIQSPKLQSRLHEAAARTHLAAGDPAQALSFARLALESASAARLASAQAGAELLVAECLAAAQPEGAPAEAIECARRAAEIAIASDLPEPRWQAHALLSSLHQREGRRIPEREELGRAAAVLQRVSDGIEDEQVRLAYLAEPRRADVMRRAGALSRRTIAPRQGEREDASPERVLAAMFELSDIISSQSDLDTMLDRLLDVGLGIVGAERGLIILLDEKTGEQRVTAARDLEEETVRDALEYSHSVVQDAAAGQVLVTLDARQDDRFRKYKSVNLYAIKSLMCVPMRSRDRVIGTVYVDSRRRGIPFNQQDLRFLEAFGNLAGSAVELSRLHERLASENTYLRQEAVGRHRFQNLIGKNVKMQAVYDLMEKVASSNLPVLIQGESGTGKELVARALHYSGPRRSRKFYCENVAAIPDTLLESAMFGHVRGAFTGADRDHKGLFELADGGTLFLDEIGDMSLPLQSKVLRALQEGEIRPVGGKEFRKVDVRIISATNKDLEQLMKERRFREDLYFRLNVVRIALPPLRERKEDIPLLVDHFLHKAARDTGAPPKKIEMGALQLLLRYSWPGNVRELENEIQRLAVLCAGEVITQNEVMQSGELFEKITRLEEKDAFTPLEELERRQIEKALLEAAGNRARAAELLGISRATIFRKLRKFNISH